MCHQESRPWGILGTLLPAAFLLFLWLPPALLEMQVYQENIRAPERVTVHCQEFLCHISWEQPQTLKPMNPEDFTYQVDIEKQHGNTVGASQLIEVSRSMGNVYSFQIQKHPGPHTVRVRGLNRRKWWYGAWSKPVEFGLPLSGYMDPVFHLTFNPDTMLLSWVCPRDATNVRCLMLQLDKSTVVLPKIGECQCRFDPTPLHRGVQLEVRANLHHKEVRERLVYYSQGLEGSAARDFTCVVYDETQMTCTWEKGPMAPEDVQYFLFLLNGEKYLQMECPRYVPNSGTHTGCHFPRIWRTPFPMYFLINGTSQSTKIQFFDTILTIMDMKHVDLPSSNSPPNFIRVARNSSLCMVEWQPTGPLATLSHVDYTYQLEIQKQLSNGAVIGTSLVTVPGSQKNSYTLPALQRPGKISLRVRAANNLIPQWSGWSYPTQFFW